MKKQIIAALCGGLLVGIASIPLPAFSHGGEDHSHADETPTPAVIAPVSTGIRLELASPDVELLGILHAGKLTLYADHFATNAPIPNAKVELEGKGQTLTLQTDANGVAQTDAAWLAKPGHYELTASIQAKGVNDLLAGKADIPNASLESKQPGTAESSPWWKFWSSLLEDTFLPKSAFAHGGEDHGEAAPAAVALPANAQDKPARLADGSVFVPKPAQHLLGIRTVSAQPQTVAQSIELNGVVVTDPNASARLQPTMSGRVLAPATGFPTLGSRVEKGQVLALLEPAASNTDKADQREKIAAVRAELGLAEKNATRLASITGAIPQMEVDAARNAADTLQARLKALQGSLAQQPETLRAPLSGIISAANVQVGQQANAGDVLFDIIDPARLQVEALAYDPSLASQISGASAVVAGQTLKLAFVGASQQLRNQALPLRFRVEGADTLAIGQPLKVAVQTRLTLKGTPLPASAVVNNSQQEPTVWLHTSAERFAPHKVKVQPLDAATVVVVEGLPDSSVRAVTIGAALLAQVR